jgi:hypothetical protein
VPASAAGAEHLPDLSRLAGVSALAFTDIALVAFALIPAAVASAALGELPEQPDDNLSIACAAVISQRAQRGRARDGPAPRQRHCLSPTLGRLTSADVARPSDGFVTTGPSATGSMSPIKSPEIKTEPREPHESACAHLTFDAATERNSPKSQHSRRD